MLETIKENPDIISQLSENYLRTILITASNSYYNDNVSLISDKEYDSIYDELKKRNPDNPFFKSIGASIEVTHWNKESHNISMGSLSKVNTINEFKKWSNNKAMLFCIEDKLDGISINLEYKNGKLIKAITRGDGKIGENIKNNVVRMQGVKETLPNYFSGSLRGEIVLTRKDFEKINKIQKLSNAALFSNPRNAASGIAKRYDSKYSEYLSILYYDIIDLNQDFSYEEAKMLYISHNLELPVCFYEKVTMDEAIKIYNDYENYKRTKLSYDIDGLVIKIDDISKQQKLGSTHGVPKGQIAWKFGAVKVESEILNVEWQLGLTGTLTPVAKIKPVDIGGVTVRNASLANVTIFDDLKLRYNDAVLVSRRNDVIPHIEKVIKHTNNDLISKIDKCPVCGIETVIDGKFLKCDNPSCKGLKIGNLKKWINVLKIDEIGGKTIELLYNNKLIKTPADFYTLKNEDIAKLEGMGNRSASIIIDNLNSKKELTLSEFIGALNIPQVSVRTIESIVEYGYNKLEQIQTITENELIQIPGIETKTANFILDGLKNKNDLISKLLNVGITIKTYSKKWENKDDINGILNGLSFCFTGAIQKEDENGKRYTRNMMENIVKQNGGIISSVKPGLSYLVMADPNSNSSKAQKARKLNINILSEKKFFEMIEWRKLCV